MTHEPTVYVNDTYSADPEVYHDRKHHATKRRFPDRYVRETTPGEAVADGLRPCKVCDPPTPDDYAEPPPGYPFPDDDLIYCSALSDFDPDANSYVALARLPEDHRTEINGKLHENTHRLVIHSPTRGPECFLTTFYDAQALICARLVLKSERDSGFAERGVATLNDEFFSRKTGVDVRFNPEEADP